MGLTVGLDFGTSTTCIAIFNERTVAPEAYLLDGAAPLVRSQVWLEQTDHSGTEYAARHPQRVAKAFAEEAVRSERAYWKRRMAAYGDYLRKAKWQQAGHEGDFLLSMFKPELADEVEPVADVERTEGYWFNPLTQSTESLGFYASSIRWLARPAPATEDFVTGTAFIVRQVLEKVVRDSGQKIDKVGFGMPSIADVSGDEYRRAKERRQEIWSLARISEDFGSARLKPAFVGEALAAAYVADVPEGASRAYAIILDVGAGTTDLSLVRYAKSRRSGWQPDEELCKASVRVAGRDINVALSAALLPEKRIKQAYAAMEPRMVQRFLDNEIEDIKCRLTKSEQAFPIDFFRFASHPDGPGGARKHYEALHRTITVYLGLEAAAEYFARRFGKWRSDVHTFLEQAATLVPDDGSLVGVELVGGSFRFAPLREAAESLVAECLGPNLRVRYRDDHGMEAQTAVARGLARRMAIGPD